MGHYSSFCFNIKNNLKFSENSKICIFFIKITEFGTKFRLNAYQNVFNSFFFDVIFGQLGYTCEKWIS